MRAFLHHFLSLLGAAGFLTCMAMLLTRPANFASYVPERVEVKPQEKLEAPPTVHVILDPGHGGIDGGTFNKSLLEKDLSLAVARMVRDEVEAAGLENVKVILTREDDVYLSLHQRVALANQHPASYFVSIHFNGSRHRTASGTETFFANPKPAIIQNQIRRRLGLAKDTPLRDDRGERFARIMQSALVDAIGSRDRKIRNNPQLVLPREVIGPAILVECVFLSNPSEARKLRRQGYLEEIASGISEGILAYVKETAVDPFANVGAAETALPVAATLSEEAAAD